MARLLTMALALFCAIAPLQSRTVRAETSISVSDAWARETPPAARSGVVYLKIANTGETPDLLVGASTDLGRGELHEHVRDGDVMRMRRLTTGIGIPAGETTALEPGGMHIMLLDLTQPLQAGATFPLTLHFERMGEHVVTVAVKPIGGDDDGHGHERGHGHGHGREHTH